jgi:hypothetical protein
MAGRLLLEDSEGALSLVGNERVIGGDGQRTLPDYLLSRSGRRIVNVAPVWGVLSTLIEPL